MTVDFILPLLYDSIRAGRPLKAAADHLKKVFPALLVDQCVQQIRSKIGEVAQNHEPPAIHRGELPWYPGTLEGDIFWPALRDWLLGARGWPAPVVDAVDLASTRVMSLLPDPAQQSFSGRGLLLGHVQSGKTAAYTAVVAKAADTGYRLFIVLSGLHDGLRRQTQERLQQETAALNPAHWHLLTTPDRDFIAPSGPPAAFLTDIANQRVLCVVKKNAARLRKLRAWLRRARSEDLLSCPALIIDDEADQASINTQETDKPSVINGLIVDILKHLPRCAYLACTATPFANVLSDPSLPELLYPRDFILDLPRPVGYFGAEQLFGRAPDDQESDAVQSDGLDVIRPIPVEEVPALQPQAKDRQTFTPEVTPALEDALRWFWLSSAARRVRGIGNPHMSMLVHTSVYVDVHEEFQPVLDGYRALLLQRLRRGDAQAVRALEALWIRECARLTAAAMGERPVTFPELMQRLPEVLDATRIIIENGRSVNRLRFEDNNPQTCIVVGGNTLSRGLTIEGLSTSFFVRTTGAYDTLLQMGRWFGYRHGYSDLARVWITDDLADAFAHLSLVEKELRDDIARYEETPGLTPLDVAPRIRTHPALAITSPLKLRYAVDAEIDFQDSVRQTTFFERDAAWLEGNTLAARLLLARASEYPREKVWGRHILYRGVDLVHVREFLSGWRTHARHEDMRREPLLQWIAAQAEDGMLRHWNVGVVSMLRGQGGEERLWDGLLPLGEPIRMIGRAPLRGDGPWNVKAIMSQSDRGIDLYPSPPSVGDKFAAAVAARRSPPASTILPDTATGRFTPLLLLYPIDPRSRARSPERVDLDAPHPLIGLALIFPRTRQRHTETFKTADLSRFQGPVEELEYTPEET